jgi:MFS family permease
MKINFSINRVIKTLIISDFVLFSSINLMAPILPVFIISQIQGGDIRVVGIAAGLQWIARAIFELPFALYYDKHKGEMYDFIGCVVGSLIASTVPFFLIFAHTPLQVYLIQFFSGIGFAMNHPSWTAIFNRHVDRQHVAYDWGVYGVVYAIGIGLAGILSGFLAYNWGYKPLFIIVGVLSLIGSLILLFARSSMEIRKK